MVRGSPAVPVDLRPERLAGPVGQRLEPIFRHPPRVVRCPVSWAASCFAPSMKSSWGAMLMGTSKRSASVYSCRSRSAIVPRHGSDLDLGGQFLDRVNLLRGRRAEGPR